MTSCLITSLCTVTSGLITSLCTSALSLQVSAPWLAVSLQFSAPWLVVSLQASAQWLALSLQVTVIRGNILTSIPVCHYHSVCSTTPHVEHPGGVWLVQGEINLHRFNDEVQHTTWRGKKQDFQAAWSSLVEHRQNDWIRRRWGGGH